MNEIATLKESIRKDYALLPLFLKNRVDRECPEITFENEDDELRYLMKKQSRLASIWMGMYAFITIGGIAIVSALYFIGSAIGNYIMR